MLLQLQIIPFTSGGYFTSIDSNPRVNLASYDISTKTAVLKSWEQDTNGTVYAFATSSAALYAGGIFSTVSGSAQPLIAAFDLNSGSLINSFAPSFTNAGTIRALEYDNNKVYAGGIFTSVNGNAFENLVSLDTATGGADLSWVPNTNYPVYTLAIEKNYIYAGEGNYGSGGYAQAYNIENGNSIDWYPQDTQPVLSMLATDPALYVGLSADGYFGLHNKLDNTLAVKNSNTNLFNIVPVAQAADHGNLLADIGGLSGTIYLAKFDAIPPPSPSPAPTSAPSPTVTSAETPTPTPTSTSGQGPVYPKPCSDQKPGTPSNIQLAAGPGTGQVTLSWTAPTGPVTDYSITYSTDNPIPECGGLSVRVMLLPILFQAFL
jgi:hypothetical protein